MQIIQDKPEIATFIHRPNRFTVECTLDGRTISAYLPNPGRLWELLLPDSKLYIVKNSPDVKMPYVVVAVQKENIPILLHTHLTNTVVEALLKEKRIPGFEDATIIRREASFGKSRFDFLLMRNKKTMFLEVKNCTLFGKTLAMFPDAVTERGSRHLKDLRNIAGQGIAAGVLFVVQWPHARFFMPEYHTDLDFAQQLIASYKKLDVRAISLQWNNDLTLGPEVKELTIPWETIEKNAHDRGNYIVILRLIRDETIEIGELGKRFFKKGYYLYVGSAKKALSKRIERHVRKRKNLFWHIDYLREHALMHKTLPIRTSVNLECAIANSLGKTGKWSIKGFGSSDCSCKTHLFGMNEDPVKFPAFIQMLHHYRIGLVERELPQ